MQKLALFVALAALYGCGGAGTDVGPLGEAMDDGNWFCESAPDGESWDCIQDPELARTPRPTRSADPTLEMDAAGPAPEAQEQAGAMAGAEIVEDLGALTNGDPVHDAAFAPPATQAPTPEAAMTVSVAAPPPAAEAPGIAPTIAFAAVEPEHTEVLSLPGHHYAVQLLAMADTAQLQEFIARHQLEGTLTARVERNGELYYVLLLGVYDTLERARQASLDLPPPLDTSEPWIRPIASLQRAIVRGNALALATD